MEQGPQKNSLWSATVSGIGARIWTAREKKTCNGAPAPMTHAKKKESAASAYPIT